MFENTQFPAIDMAFPDVCLTPSPVGPVPIPYPNISITATAIPTIFNQFITAMPTHNLLTTVPLSNGDQGGVAGGGVVTALIMGPCRRMLGSTAVFRQCMPTVRMLDMTGQNGPTSNIPGLTLSPSQIKTLVLR